MTLLLILLIVMWTADVVRLRGRLRAMPVLRAEADDGDSIAEESWAAQTTQGLELPRNVRLSAAAAAAGSGLSAVDLVPARLSAERLLGVLLTVDPRTERDRPLARGHSAAQATVFDRSVGERARVVPGVESRPGGMIEAFAELKACAPERTGHLLAAELEPVRKTPTREALELHAVLGNILPVVLGVQVFLILLLWWGVLTRPLLGLPALLLFHAQPWLISAGTAARPWDLTRACLLRSPLMLARAFSTLMTMLEGPDKERCEARRPWYKEKQAAGGFHQPAFSDCPHCGSDRPVVHLITRDYLQHKPGRFCLDRCRRCGTIFQNPRLSVAGLEYYYADFYDGLGARDLENVFASSTRAYEGRARMAEAGGTEIRRWLDVGGGHGHFCLAAREHLPGVEFSALDLSGSIEQAERRGWVVKGYRGLFPELAPSLSPETDGDARAPFDVVSMSHYLEHTIDPRAEVEAAATVLPAGGLLLIEVPDPESRLQNLLGRWWVPWFQPQHLNLLPMKTLMELLRESGFSVVEAHRGPAHQAVDFFMAGWLILDNLAPEPDRPWMPPAASGARFKRFVVRAVLGPPLLLAGTLTDRILAAVLTRKPGWSNTYRVLARRNAPPPDPSAEPEAAEAPAATDEPAADGDSEE